MNENLRLKLNNLPDSPGCYLMKNDENKVIYVGKAKSLKKRVSQYFKGAHDYKVTKMVSFINDFEYILTKTEKEALLLEINLIKQYKPRYNVIFMDDKSYPYIKLTGDKYPSLKVARDSVKEKNAQYFGPYTDTYSARSTVDLLNRIFPLRKCAINSKKPCMYHHINQCLCPYYFHTDEHVYQDMLKEVIKVLNGDVGSLIRKEEVLMNEASQEMNYEKAKHHYDLVKALNHIKDKQHISLGTQENTDVFNYYVNNGYLSIQLIHVRNGNIIKRKSKIIDLHQDEKEAFTSYIQQYYQNGVQPKFIIVPEQYDESFLSEEIQKKIIVPQRGSKKQLLLMAYNNAVEQLDSNFAIKTSKENTQSNALKELEQIIGRELHTIEVVDNSHISGDDNVSGLIVLEDGSFNKNEYRRFKLENRNDDYKSMEEVVYRRYVRLLKEGKKMPDLLLVDGGYAQISSAKKCLDILNIDIPVYGLSKDDKHNTSRLVQDDGTIVDIDKSSSLFFFLTNIQDEVHRYALSYHHKLRNKKTTKSVLDEIKGIREKRKKLLLKEFKSVSRIKEATLEELSKVVPNDVAVNIIEYFKENG